MYCADDDGQPPVASGDRSRRTRRADRRRPARAFYRGQCNCPYWHGAFGGVYLPHLRNAIYHQLIAADNLLDRAAASPSAWVELTADDYNFDGRQEVQLANDQLVALIAPGRGGQLYELDVRSICHNLLATLTRRPEAYHRKVLAGDDGRNDVAGVSDRVIFKQAGPRQRAAVRRPSAQEPARSFLRSADVTLDAVARGEAPSGATSCRGPTKPGCAAIRTACRCS